MKKATIKNERVIGGKINITLDGGQLSIYNCLGELVVQKYINKYIDFENSLFMSDICSAIPLIEQTWKKLTGNKASRL